jgi:RNA polymerase sigma-70 factor (ECF subfamily)
LEDELARLCAAREYESALTLLLKGYGPELLGFLVGLRRGNAAEASDIFSHVCEDLWQGLPGFERRSSYKTWAYVLTRHALARFQRSGPQRRARRTIPLSLVTAISKLEERVRSASISSGDQRARSRMTQIREALPEDDQMLLVLRVDRGLDWNDVARVLLGEALDAEGLRRGSARLRKRFEVLKRKLRKQAAEERLTGRD